MKNNEAIRIAIAETSVIIREITVVSAEIPLNIFRQLRTLFSEAFFITQLLILIFRKVPKDPVPNLIPLQLEAITQLDTVTCSTSNPGISVLKQMPSSSQSTIQSDMTTFLLLISIPSQL